MADTLYSAAIGDSRQEILHSTNWVFVSGFAVQFSDTSDTPSTSDRTPSGAKFLRVRSNGDIVCWNGTVWILCGKDSILAAAQVAIDANSVSDRAYTDSKVAAVPTAFRGSLALADATPALDGVYFFSQSGTYTNFGGVVVDLTQGLVYGTKLASVFTKTVIPIVLTNYTLQTDFLPVKDKTSVIEDKSYHGYLLPIVDNTNRLIFGIRSDSTAELKLDYGSAVGPLGQVLPFKMNTSNGFLLSFVDSNNNILFGVRTNGHGIVGGKDVTMMDSRIIALESGTSLVREGRHWGDSLTQGAGGLGTTYVNVLQSLLGTGYSAVNCGVGGEDVNTISARQGGIPVQFQNAFTLPADGSTVQVWTTSNAGVLNKYGRQISPLLQGNGNSINPCYVSGIECTLSYISDDPTNTPYVGKYYLKRNVNSSSHTAIPAGIQLFLNGAKRKNAYYDIYWIGQNLGYSNEDELVSYYKDLISYNNNSNYIIIGLHTGTAATRATLETKMFQAFGHHYFNWRQYVVNFGLQDAGISPTTADNNAIAVGSCPPSLLFDSTHFNAQGYIVLGNAIYKYGQQLGIF